MASGFNPGSGNGGNYSNPSGGANSASSPPNDTASGSGGVKGSSSGGQPQSGGSNSSQTMQSDNSENSNGGSNVNYSNPAQSNSASQQGSEGKENKHGMFNTMQQADGVLGKASTAAGYVVGKTAKGAINSVKPKNLGKTAGHVVNAGTKIGNGVKSFKNIKNVPKTIGENVKARARYEKGRAVSAASKVTNAASKAKQDFSSAYNDVKVGPTRQLKDFNKSDYEKNYNGNSFSSFSTQSDKLLRGQYNGSIKQRRKNKNTSQNYTPQNYLSNKEIAREINSKLQSPTVKTEKGDKK